MSGERENAGKRGLGRKEKEWTDCVAEYRRLFGITGTGAPPHLTLGSGAAQYVKGAEGLWPRE